MLTPVVQRWAEKRGSYRPAGEVIDTRQYEIVTLTGDREAKAFVQQHHYSGSYPAARERFGLYRSSELVGVAVFSVPVQPRALDKLPGGRESCVEFGRLVLLDDVPGNGESWFIGECMRRLRQDGYTGIVSFADPVPRRTVEGTVVFPGHIGTIYQATNAVYTGQASKRTLRLLPDGTVLHPRAIAKIKTWDCGWHYCAERLVRFGAAKLEPGADSHAWLAEWLPKLTRPLSHTGNHRYLWALNKRDRKHLPAGQPYPKFTR